jgi:hypothetical protein
MQGREVVGAGLQTVFSCPSSSETDFPTPMPQVSEPSPTPIFVTTQAPSSSLPPSFTPSHTSSSTPSSRRATCRVRLRAIARRPQLHRTRYQAHPQPTRQARPQPRLLIVTFQIHPALVQLSPRHRSFVVSRKTANTAPAGAPVFFRLWERLYLLSDQHNSYIW